MPTASPSYVGTTTHTITLASLANSATAGREGTAIDNAGTEDAIDAVLGGFITTGTSPTVNTPIFIYVYGSYDGTSYSGAATGSDAALTPAAEGLLKLAQVINVTASSNVKYTFCVGSVAALFGGVLPREWGVFVRNNTGVALNSTAGNHEIKHSYIKFESA